MSSEWKKIIVHVDMDAFFAAVEQLHHPEWRGKPVIVGADPRGGRGRGVVSTASYEARKFGVYSAMPISQAYRLCPHGIYVAPNSKLYARYSRKIFEVLSQFTPRIQAISIDEAFMDVSGSVHLFGSVKALALEIKKRIRSQTGLSASVGVATSKSVAKIASDIHKPDGLTIVPPTQVHEFLDPLPVSKLWGVGEKTLVILQQLGIHTVRQLRHYPADTLQSRLGNYSKHLQQMAKGVDEREVELDEEIKSVSHEITFEQDQSDWEFLVDHLLNLSEKVGSRLRKYGLRGKTVQLKLRFEDFSTHIRHKTLPTYTNLTHEIFMIGKKLLQQFRPLSKPVRLIGIGVSHLIDEQGLQISLWDTENERKLQLEKIMDQLQEKYGNLALTHAQTLAIKKRPREDHH